MDKPVILMLGKLPPPYMGPSIATEIILKSSLRDHFHLVHLDTKAYSQLDEFGKWSFRKVFSNLKKYSELRRLIKIHKPSVVWIPVSQTTTGFVKDAIYIWIAALSGIKVVIHLRGSAFRQWLESASSITRFFVTKTLKKCKAVIVLGQSLRSLFKGFFRDEMIFVVPNGADYEFPEQVHAKNGKVKILYIANLQPSKGIQDVLMAVNSLNRTHAGKFSLDVVGSWRNAEFMTACEKLIRDHELPVSVHTPDQKPDKFKFLRESDIFVFTPRMPEGHPWVIVEAMAAGLPIISTNQGAITESVIHEKNGFIVNTPDPSQIASRLSDLIENAELRQRMGEESRKQYLGGFTEKKMVERLVAVFQSVIKN